MGQEVIGSVSEWEPGWETDLAYEMAINFLNVALGDPPYGVTIEVAWQDHDLGSYPVVAVNWEVFGGPEPWEFIRRAEEALSEFNQAIDWRRIRPSNFRHVDNDGEEVSADDDRGHQNTLRSFPAFDEKSYEVVKPYFENALKAFVDAGKTLKDLFKFLTQNFGEGIRPYAIRFAQDNNLGTNLGGNVLNEQALAQLAQRFAEGGRFANITEARKAVMELTGQTIEAGSYSAKRTDELIEAALVRAAQTNVDRNEGNLRETYRALDDLFECKPRLAECSGVLLAEAGDADQAKDEIATAAERGGLIDNDRAARGKGFSRFVMDLPIYSIPVPWSGCVGWLVMVGLFSALTYLGRWIIEAIR